MKIFAAPLQGHTQAAWRRHHAAIFGAIDTYFTPFLRVEKGETRRRDRNDIAPENNMGVNFVPQALFRDVAEFRIIASDVVAAGCRRLDLNLGCPFPPQTRHGRGAAVVRNPGLLVEIARTAAAEFPSLRLSVKTRLGLESPSEWRGIVDQLNSMPLEYVAIHPRVARQQYGGELHLDEFEQFMAASTHPTVYNGDILSLHDMNRLRELYPALHGVMIGRGLLARPSLAAEWRSGAEMDADELRQRLLDLHEAILDEYSATLCGDAQIISKIKPFWEFQRPDDIFPRRFLKQLSKATTLAKYRAALAL